MKKINLLFVIVLVSLASCSVEPAKVETAPDSLGVAVDTSAVADTIAPAVTDSVDTLK